MKECKSCGKEISKKAKTCPNCGLDQRNFFLRHKIITGFLILIAIIVIASIGSGSGESGESANSDEAASSDESANESTSTEDSNSEETTESNEKSNDESLEKTEFSVGEPVELNGQVITVTEVEKSYGNEFDKPAEGKEYVIVHVKIENNGDRQISYNPFNFKMKNSNGQIEDQGLITIDQETSLSSGELATGGTVSGTLSFEQPVDDELQLVFEPSFWNEDKITFNLSE